MFYDYWEAIRYADEEGKPVFIDFTGWACVNCRKMEENVFPEVEETLNQYILCQLYVDEKTRLPLPESVIVPNSSGGTKKKIIKTIGNKWSTLQAVTYASASQPYYVLYCPERGLLTNPVGYTPDKVKFRDWLECGINEFNTKK